MVCLENIYSYRRDTLVSASEAGYGNMEIIVKNKHDENIPSQVEVVRGKAATFCVRFSPQQPGEHSIDIKYNDVPVSGNICRFRTN